MENSSDKDRNFRCHGWMTGRFAATWRFHGRRLSQPDGLRVHRTPQAVVDFSTFPGIRLQEQILLLGQDRLGLLRSRFSPGPPTCIPPLQGVSHRRRSNWESPRLIPVAFRIPAFPVPFVNSCGIPNRIDHSLRELLPRRRLGKHHWSNRRLPVRESCRCWHRERLRWTLPSQTSRRGPAMGTLRRGGIVEDVVRPICCGTLLVSPVANCRAPHILSPSPNGLPAHGLAQRLLPGSHL
jgi:hypothetical protein